MRKRDVRVSIAALLVIALGLVDEDGAVLPLPALCLGGHLLLDLSGDGHGELHEGLLHVDVFLGTHLHEGALAVICQQPSLLRTHLPLPLQVALVPHQQLRETTGSVLLQLHHPVPHVLEGPSIIDCVDDDYPRGPLEVGISERSEAFLAGSVPELQFDASLIVLVIDCGLDDFGAEVYADGGRVGHGVVLVDEAQQQVGLPHCRVADYHDLRQVVVVALLWLTHLLFQSIHPPPNESLLLFQILHQASPQIVRKNKHITPMQNGRVLRRLATGIVVIVLSTASLYRSVTAHYNRMSVVGFEQRLQQLTMSMNTAPPAALLAQLKALQHDISQYLSAGRVEEDDALSEMQIAVFNNLACLYERRGKYRSSLYHLQLAEELENKYFTHKYQGSSIPLSALEKLATTYSNLSAVQSKLGNYPQALLNAEFAIQVLSRDAAKDHCGLLPLYYNYSFLLDTLSRQSQASKFALEGLRLAHLHKDKVLIGKFEALVEGLKEKLARREGRKIKELKKHLKGQLGIVKNQKQIQERFLKLAETIEMEGVQLSEGRLNSSNSNFATLKQYLEAQRRHLKPSSSQVQRRHRSTYSTLNPRKNNSLQRPPSLSHHSNAQLVRNELESQKTSRPKHIPKVFSEYSDQTGKIRHNRLNSTLGGGGGRDYRIKSRRVRLVQQIQDLGRKNDALSHILQKMQSVKDQP